MNNSETERDAGLKSGGAGDSTGAEVGTSSGGMDDLETLKAKAAKSDEHWANLLRMAADFENYKKRAAREKQDAQKYAAESLISKLVPVLDTFDMALQAAQGNATSVDSIRAGVSMIQQQFRQVLMDAGMTEVDAAGQVFDPNLHEAVAQKETSEVPEGHVVEQIRKGYRLRERLLRPASVVVSKSVSKSS